jgi:hypothetical protein
MHGQAADQILIGNSGDWYLLDAVACFQRQSIAELELQLLSEHAADDDLAIE